MSLAVPAVSRFRQAFAGAVIEPGDPTFDEARRVWNAMHDRRPALVVRPSSTADVVAAVRFGREQDLAIAVRGGSHSPNGHSTCDGGLVIDLGMMSEVAVDPIRRTAVVGGGALLRSLDAAGQEHGLVCPVGVVGHTGVGGLTLGGGMGRLQRKFGLTIDNLRAVELVTADGRVVRTSADEHPELFWAIRGAGHNFGVVTRFEFDLHAFDGNLHRGVRLYPGDAVRDVYGMVQDAADRLVDEVALIVSIARAEPASEYPPALAGRPIVVVGYNHCGDAASVERDTAFLRAGPEPAVTNEGTVRYLDVQTANDEVMGWGRRSFITGGLTNGLRPAALEALVEHVAAAPLPECGFGMALLGGAIARLPQDATAFPGRHVRWEMSADAGAWTDPALDESAIDWCLTTMAIVAPDAAPGRYVNEVGESGPGVTRSIYADATYDRLATLKRAWDPDNVFRINHNVEPEA